MRNSCLWASRAAGTDVPKMNPPAANPASVKVLDNLERSIDSCMLADRWRLRNALVRLRQTGRQSSEQSSFESALATLADRVAASMSRVYARRERRPAIHYPAGLPVSARVAELKEAIAANQVVIIAGETGSGKTTQIPKLCLELGRGIHGLIGHTQPRRLAARTVAMRIADELGVREGEEVGHQVRFTDTSSEYTLIKLMTDGILLAETQNDPWLHRYDTIIIDEAHERSLNIDFLLGYLKRLLPKRPELKLIITSATIEVAKFAAHFDGAPVLEVSGRTYPVTMLYRPAEGTEDTELPEQVLAGYEHILQLERQQRQAYRDVLVFLSGEKEIRDCADLLRKQQYPGVEILPLYARLSNKEQQRVFEPHAGRRIVLTTNVAETSLTVPGIGYVIDSGFARISRYSVRSKIQRLPVEPVSRASANQRAGRCGRLGPGTCLRLYAEEDFNGRPEFTEPEILRTNLASVILQMLALKLGNIDDFPFLDPPDSRAIRDGFHLLEELQAVDAKDVLTLKGRDMARLPVDPRLARVLLEAGQRHCLHELLIIVSALGIQDPRERPLERQQAADEAHRRFWHVESDFLAFVNLWNFHEEQRQQIGTNKMRKFCQQNFLSYMRMREWREVHRQLLLLCQELKLPINKEPATYEEIHQSVLTGFISQVASRLEDGSYLGARSRKYVVFPGSTLHRKQQRWLVSAELVETTQLYARMNARVEPEWIEKLALHLVRKEYAEPHWEQKRGQVMAYEKVLLYGLPLVERRRVAYGRIDPVVSRQLLIREALVTMQLKTRAPFFDANCRLIHKIAELEERTRRRDILIDDNRIAEFYEQQLPASVVDVASLERWYFSLPKDKAARLLLTEQQLQHNAVDAAELAQFPEQATTSAMAMALNYAFAPGKEHDGVSVDIPVTILKQLRPEELDWLVPGLLKDKCIALIKALPKSLRKHFVPVPDVVDKLLPHLKQQDGTLQQALTRQLLRHSGVQLPVDCWQAVQLPDHLQLMIRVLDENGKLLGSGRDLEALKTSLGREVQASISKAAGQGGTSGEQQGLTEWSFDGLPQEQELGTSKLRIKSYPALIDRGQSVDLCLLDTPYRARLASVMGVSRLFMLQSRQQLRYLQKDLLQDASKLYALQQLGKRDEVLDQLIQRAYCIAFRVEEELPRSREQFEQRLLQCRSEVLTVAISLQELLYKVLQRWHELRKRLQHKAFTAASALALQEDVQAQLQQLVFPGFLLTTPWLHLQQLPRYLEAVQQRLDKYPTQVARDQEWTRLLARLWQQYSQRQQYCAGREIRDEALDEYRWLLEELRVSLFAQALGTRLPVSEKRLEKFWQDQVLK